MSIFFQLFLWSLWLVFSSLVLIMPAIVGAKLADVSRTGNSAVGITIVLGLILTAGLAFSAIFVGFNVATLTMNLRFSGSFTALWITAVSGFYWGPAFIVSYFMFKRQENRQGV